MTKKMYQPFFWGDYLRDTGQLSLLEHGVYLRMIGEYWNTGKPFSDGVRMCRALNVQSEEEREAVKHILNQYFYYEDGVWRHNRIERSLKEHAERADAASEQAKKAAEARWNAASMRGALPEASDEQCSIDANHTIPYHNHTQATPLHSTPPPIQSNIKDLGVGKGGLGETQEGEVGSFKNKKEGGWDILHYLSADTLESARSIARNNNKDFYFLVDKYNRWVANNGKPDKPNSAFIPWMKKFIEANKG